MRRLRLAVVVAGVLAVAAGLALLGVAWSRGPTLETAVIQAGLTIPWGIAFAPDGRMLVTERAGTILVYESAEPGAALLGSVEVPGVRAEGEAGLMGIVVDRAYAEPWVYVCASCDLERAPDDSTWRNELLRYRLGDGGELSLESVLFDEPMAAAIHHNGCALRMDDERHIWMTMGDGNISAARVNPAQDPTQLNGKILRLTADGGVPADNPVMPGTAAPSAVYSMGHRNPQGLAMRQRDGLILAAEHGTDRDDEINRIVAGGNYGYACWSGTDSPGPAMAGPAGDECGAADLYLPAAWASGEPTLATSSAAFLEGDGWEDWEGSLVVTTLKEEDLRRFVVGDDGSLEAAGVLLDGDFGRLRAAVIGPDAALYLSTSNGDGQDRIIRVVRDD